MIRKMILISMGAMVIAIPLLFNRGLTSFIGTDDQVGNKITEINGKYSPWFNMPNNPFSKLDEDVMFSLQAALGVGFIAYFMSKKKNV